MNELNKREENILKAIIGEFISSALPVGSNTLKKRRNIKFSPATIRHVMNDLEETGYLSHPHTSAGRVPTSKGYRFFVDLLDPGKELSLREQEEISDSLRPYAVDIESLLSTASRLLGEFTSDLGIAIAPFILEGELTRINLFSVSSQTVMLVLQLNEGFAKTIVLEIRSSIPTDALDVISTKLNEKLSGLSLREIRKSISMRCSDLTNESSGIVRMLIDSADRVFDFSENEKITFSGSANIMSKPEFADPKRMKSLLSVIENEKNLIKRIQESSSKKGVSVIIGDELDDPDMSELSFVTSPYNFGNQVGIIAVVGPLRMHYEKAMTIVVHTANTLSQTLSN